MDHAVLRYLEAKRSVDDRARSRRVRDRLLAALPSNPRIVEAGPGAGGTVANLLEWDVTDGTYEGIDAATRAVAHARAARPPSLRRAGYGVRDGGTESESDFRVEGLDVRFRVGDALEALPATTADLVVAQSFMDLVPIDRAVDAVEAALVSGGLAYLPLTFDGGTVFGPAHPADDAVERAYHAAIDAETGRNAGAGRHLLAELEERDGDLLAVASSDWIVRPRDGEYPADERYFLERILGFVADALAERPVEGSEDWLATRRRQLADSALFYVAHQYDLLYRRAGP